MAIITGFVEQAINWAGQSIKQKHCRVERCLHEQNQRLRAKQKIRKPLEIPSTAPKVSARL
jgi:hypothetical protein